MPFCPRRDTFSRGCLFYIGCEPMPFYQVLIMFIILLTYITWWIKLWLKVYYAKDEE